MSRKTVYQAQTKNSNSLSKPYRQWKGKSVSTNSTADLLCWSDVGVVMTTVSRKTEASRGRTSWLSLLPCLPAVRRQCSPSYRQMGPSELLPGGNLRDRHEGLPFFVCFWFFFNNTYIKQKQSSWCLHGVNWDQIKSQRGGCPWWLYNAISWLYRDGT